MSHYFGLNRLDEQIEHYVNFDNGIFFEAGANDGETERPSPIRRGVQEGSI